jgi:hypothetical protein
MSSKKSTTKSAIASTSNKRRVLRVTRKADTAPTNENPPANPHTMLTVPLVDGTLTEFNTEVSSPPETNEQPQVVETERQAARRAARIAVAAYYPGGASFPYKAAVDLRFRAAVNNNRSGTEQTLRVAAGIAAIITYCEISPDGTFIRGSGRVPGKLLGYTGKKANDTFRAGPESGLLSQLYSGNASQRRIEYITGSLHGVGAELTTFKLNFDQCRKAMLAFNNKTPDGGRLFSAPLRLLRAIEKRAETPADTPAQQEPASAPEAASVPDTTVSDNASV